MFDKIASMKYPVFTVVYAMRWNKSMDKFLNNLEFLTNELRDMFELSPGDKTWGEKSQSMWAISELREEGYQRDAFQGIFWKPSKQMKF